jgi:hypothetical protein
MAIRYSRKKLYVVMTVGVHRSMSQKCGEVLLVISHTNQDEGWLEKKY